MLTIPPILSTITKLLAICEDFCQFMQVCITSLSHPFIPFLFSFLLIFEHCNQLLVRFYHLWKRVFLLISILYKYFFCYANIYRGCSVILWKRNWVHCQILFMNPLHRYIMCLESLAFTSWIKTLACLIIFGLSFFWTYGTSLQITIPW